MRIHRWLALCCAAVMGLMACLPALAEGGAGEGGEVTLESYEIASAEYPERPRNPFVPDPAAGEMTDDAFDAAFNAWMDAQQARGGIPVANPDGLNDFFARSARTLLADVASENAVYSPVNLWFALDMLASLTSGESRDQILFAMGESSPESMAAQRQSLWDTQYWDDGETTCIPGVSLWLNRDVSIGDETLAALKSELLASVFRGDMADGAYSAALRAWIDRQTKNLLSNALSGLSFDPDTELSVCSTLYFKAGWTNTFSEGLTGPRAFHAPGGNVELPFMNGGADGMVYSGSGFSAVTKPLNGDAHAVFILPDADLTPMDVLAGEDVFAFLRDIDAWENREPAIVNLSVPKLNCMSGLSLRETLQNLGITDIFDAGTADFSGALSSDGAMNVKSVEQFARLTMDEQGVEAAAVTIVNALGALAANEREIDFVVDRPFLLAILGERDVPLFFGMINMP